jgi:hypothetical protein
VADNDADEIIGGIALVFLVVAAVIAAVMAVLLCGSILGSGVGLVNYLKAFNANVRFERPAVV